MKKIVLLMSIFLLNTSNNENKEYCEIKGNVNNPGVYEIKNNTINDVINIAGGLKENSYTKNINLSKKVKDEMVIYIFSNNEIEKIKNINNCICTPKYIYKECTIPTTTTSTTTTKTTHPPTKETTTTTKTTTEIITTSTLININLCTKEELLTINGLGKVKAQAIIDYRLENGLFTTIEDIKKVNGIGESTFEKIKPFITI